MTHDHKQFQTSKMMDNVQPPSQYLSFVVWMSEKLYLYHVSSKPIGTYHKPMS